MQEFRPDEVNVGIPKGQPQQPAANPNWNQPGTPGAMELAPDQVMVSDPNTLPSGLESGVYGGLRNTLPTIGGLLSIPFGAVGGAAVGSPMGPAGAATGAFLGGAAINAATSYGIHQAQQALVPVGERERMAMALNPSWFAAGGYIPSVATGKPISPKDLSGKAGAIAQRKALGEFGGEFGGELVGGAVVNALSGQPIIDSLTDPKQLGMAALDAVLFGQNTRLGDIIASPSNRLVYGAPPSQQPAGAAPAQVPPTQGVPLSPRQQALAAEAGMPQVAPQAQIPTPTQVPAPAQAGQQAQVPVTPQQPVVQPGQPAPGVQRTPLPAPGQQQAPSPEEASQAAMDRAWVDFRRRLSDALGKPDRDPARQEARINELTMEAALSFGVDLNKGTPDTVKPPAGMYFDPETGGLRVGKPTGSSAKPKLQTPTPPQGQTPQVQTPQGQAQPATPAAQEETVLDQQVGDVRIRVVKKDGKRVLVADGLMEGKPLTYELDEDGSDDVMGANRALNRIAEIATASVGELDKKIAAAKKKLANDPFNLSGKTDVDKLRRDIAEMEARRKKISDAADRLNNQANRASYPKPQQAAPAPKPAQQSTQAAPAQAAQPDPAKSKRDSEVAQLTGPEKNGFSRAQYEDDMSRPNKIETILDLDTNQKIDDISQKPKAWLDAFQRRLQSKVDAFIEEGATREPGFGTTLADLHKVENEIARRNKQDADEEAAKIEKELKDNDIKKWQRLINAARISLNKLKSAGKGNGEQAKKLMKTINDAISELKALGVEDTGEPEVDAEVETEEEAKPEAKAEADEDTETRAERDEDEEATDEDEQDQDEEDQDEEQDEESDEDMDDEEGFEDEITVDVVTSDEVKDIISNTLEEDPDASGNNNDVYWIKDSNQDGTRFALRITKGMTKKSFNKIKDDLVVEAADPDEVEKQLKAGLVPVHSRLLDSNGKVVAEIQERVYDESSKASANNFIGNKVDVQTGPGRKSPNAEDKLRALDYAFDYLRYRISGSRDGGIAGMAAYEDLVRMAVEANRQGKVIDPKSGNLLWGTTWSEEQLPGNDDDRNRFILVDLSDGNHKATFSDLLTLLFDPARMNSAFSLLSETLDGDQDKISDFLEYHVGRYEYVTGLLTIGTNKNKGVVKKPGGYGTKARMSVSRLMAACAKHGIEFDENNATVQNVFKKIGVTPERLVKMKADARILAAIMGTKQMPDWLKSASLGFDSIDDLTVSFASGWSGGTVFEEFLPEDKSYDKQVTYNLISDAIMGYLNKSGIKIPSDTLEEGFEIDSLDEMIDDNGLADNTTKAGVRLIRKFFSRERLALMATANKLIIDPHKVAMKRSKALSKDEVATIIESFKDDGRVSINNGIYFGLASKGTQYSGFSYTFDYNFSKVADTTDPAWASSFLSFMNGLKEGGLLDAEQIEALDGLVESWGKDGFGPLGYMDADVLPVAMFLYASNAHVMLVTENQDSPGVQSSVIVATRADDLSISTSNNEGKGVIVGPNSLSRMAEDGLDDEIELMSIAEEAIARDIIPDNQANDLMNETGKPFNLSEINGKLIAIDGKLWVISASGSIKAKSGSGKISIRPEAGGESRDIDFEKGLEGLRDAINDTAISGQIFKKSPGYFKKAMAAWDRIEKYFDDQDQDTQADDAEQADQAEQEDSDDQEVRSERLGELPRMETFDDVLAFRESKKQEDIGFFQSLGFSKKDAESLFRALDQRSNSSASKFLDKLSDEDRQKFDEWEKKDNAYEFDETFNPEQLRDVTDVKELARSFAQGVVRDGGKSRFGDTFVFTVAALRLLKQNGGTWSDVAMALDSITTKSSSNQEDKKYGFKKFSEEAKALADDQGIELEMGDLGNKAVDGKDAAMIESKEIDMSGIKEDVDDLLSQFEDINLSQADAKMIFGTKKKKGIIQEIKDAVDNNDKVTYLAMSARLSEIMESLQERQDNTPDSLQDSEVYENRQEAIDLISDVMGELDQLLDGLEEASEAEAPAQVQPEQEPAKPTLADAARERQEEMAQMSAEDKILLPSTSDSDELTKLKDQARALKKSGKTDTKQFSRLMSRINNLSSGKYDKVSSDKVPFRIRQSAVNFLNKSGVETLFRKDDPGPGRNRFSVTDPVSGFSMSTGHILMDGELRKNVSGASFVVIHKDPRFAETEEGRKYFRDVHDALDYMAQMRDLADSMGDEYPPRAAELAQGRNQKLEALKLRAAQLKAEKAKAEADRMEAEIKAEAKPATPVAEAINKPAAAEQVKKDQWSKDANEAAQRARASVLSGDMEYVDENGKVVSAAPGKDRVMRLADLKPDGEMDIKYDKDGKVESAVYVVDPMTQDQMAAVLQSLEEQFMESAKDLPIYKQIERKMMSADSEVSTIDRTGRTEEQSDAAVILDAVGRIGIPAVKGANNQLVVPPGATQGALIAALQNMTKAQRLKVMRENKQLTALSNKLKDLIKKAGLKTPKASQADIQEVRKQIDALYESAMGDIANKVHDKPMSAALQKRIDDGGAGDFPTILGEMAMIDATFDDQDAVARAMADAELRDRQDGDNPFMAVEPMKGESGMRSKPYESRLPVFSYMHNLSSEQIFDALISDAETIEESRLLRVIKDILRPGAVYTAKELATKARAAMRDGQALVDRIRSEVESGGKSPQSLAWSKKELKMAEDAVAMMRMSIEFLDNIAPRIGMDTNKITIRADIIGDNPDQSIGGMFNRETMDIDLNARYAATAGVNSRSGALAAIGHVIAHEIGHRMGIYAVKTDGEARSDAIALLAHAEVEMRKMNIDTSIFYGMTKPGEFVTEALSNPIFAAILNQISAPEAISRKYKNKGSLMSNLVSVIKMAMHRVFGIPVKTDSILDAVIRYNAAAVTSPDGDRIAIPQPPRRDMVEEDRDLMADIIAEAQGSRPEYGDLLRPAARKRSLSKAVGAFVRGRYFSGISAKAHEIAARYRRSKAGRGSPTALAVANMVHARPGVESRAFEQDIPTAIDTKRIELRNKFIRIMEPLRAEIESIKGDGVESGEKLREKIYGALTDMIEGRKPITKGELGKAASELRQLIADMKTYQEQAGVLFEEADDYFPHIYNDDLIRANADEFLARAVRAYTMRLERLAQEELAAGAKFVMSPAQIDAEAQILAKQWLERVMTGLPEEEQESILGESRELGEIAVKKRKFNKEESKIMSDFMVKDPFRIMGRYINQSVQRAEVARRFGHDGKNWSVYADAMAREGVTPEDIKEIRSLLRKAVGQGISPKSKAEQGYMDTLSFLTAASFMGRSALNNLVEPAIAGVRTGNPMVALQALGGTWLRLVRMVGEISPALRKKMGANIERELGFELGLIHEDMTDAWAALHDADMFSDESNPTMRWLTNRVYQANLMNATETAKREASIAIGRRYIEAQVKWVNGKHWIQSMFGKGGVETGRIALREMGVPDSEHQAFSDFVTRLAGMDKRAYFNAVISSKSPMAKRYREAIKRFSRQSSIQVNRAHKPEFQDNTIGRTLLQLMNYSYAFTAEVNSRLYSMLKYGLTRNTFDNGSKIGIVSLDRAKLLAPGFMAVAAVMSYYWLLRLKDLMYPTENVKARAKDPVYLKALNAASYTGLFGPKIEMLVKASQRGQVPGGPVGQLLAGGVRAGVNFSESLAEGKPADVAARQLAQTAYRGVVKPAIVGGASAVNPYVGFVANTGVNDTQYLDLENVFKDMAASDPNEAGPRGPRPPRPPGPRQPPRP